VYRVLEIDGNLSSARASYFHKSIGGYHAAKPKRMQELFDYQISKNNMGVLNMLNVKYLIQTNEKGEEFPVKNPDANGNAWFVKQVQFVANADAEMKALTQFDSKNIAIVNKEFTRLAQSNSIQLDSIAQIKLIQYKPNHLIYKSSNAHDGVAVFSEMYYKDGWNAYVDAKKVDYFKANYALRAMKIPAGNHTIEFKFEPQVVKTGSIITLISSLLIVALIAGGIFVLRKESK
jgi:uncharacterized membrane protein YfhO